MERTVVGFDRGKEVIPSMPAKKKKKATKKKATKKKATKKKATKKKAKKK